MSTGKYGLTLEDEIEELERIAVDETRSELERLKAMTALTNDDRLNQMDFHLQYIALLLEALITAQHGSVYLSEIKKNWTPK